MIDIPLTNEALIGHADRQLVDRAIASMVREDFTLFSRFVWPRYEHHPHLAMIDKYLQLVVEYIETSGQSGIGNLMIELPPRHGKTRKISHMLPAYFLGRNPNKRVILASYNQSLATKNSRQVRTIMRLRRYQQVFGISMASDSQAKDHWDIADHEGGLDAVGKGAGVTGKGADCLITDDLVKSREEVESAGQRDRDWDWLLSDLLTRKQPGAAHVSVMTRWHKDDVHGRLLLEQRDKWTCLTLPALAEDNDPLGRKPGEPLCAAWYDRAKLLEIKADLGEYPFSALYQQSPMSKEGGLFKAANLQRIDHAPADIVRRVRFWDLALSSRDTADYTVGLLMGLTKTGLFIILDVVRLQKEWDEVPNEIKRVALLDGTEVSLGIEVAYFQSRAVDKLTRDPVLFQYNIKGYRPEADKLTRALPFAARAGSRQVYVLNRAWTPAYIDELTSFPMGAHDDQVDATSGAYLMLDRKPLTPEVRRFI